MAVDGDAAGGDQAIGLAAGAAAGVGDMFVESGGHRPIIRHRRPLRFMPARPDQALRRRRPGCGRRAWPRTWHGRPGAAARPDRPRPVAIAPVQCWRSLPAPVPAMPGQPR
ncbi:hypothetical protein G6F24_018711 [Rhizopus arrhizus]|nr:hypothetical protein G6F24_018711 [Rhizopus arrhizus]